MGHDAAVWAVEVLLAGLTFAPLLYAYNLWTLERWQVGLSWIQGPQATQNYPVQTS